MDGRRRIVSAVSSAALVSKPPLSATSICRGIRAGHVSASEVLEYYISRIEGLDGRTNAVVVRDFARARVQAEEADRAAARGEFWGPLHGLPMTVKDNLDVAGLPTSKGDPVLAAAGKLADASDAGVAQLQRAGAIIIGKTNLPLNGNDVQSFNSVFGTTNNPHDLARTCGGSSGGSAAAVSAGLVPCCLGTDIGGSLRFPAHCCGIFAHKPTWSLVPKRDGQGTPSNPADLWVSGPLARSAEDLALLMDVLAAPALALPPFSSTGPAAGFDYRGEPRDDSGGAGLAGWRIAVWATDPVCPIGAAVNDGLQLAVDALRQAGAVVDELARPGGGSGDEECKENGEDAQFSAALSHRVYLWLLGAATAGRLSRAAYEEMLTAANQVDDDMRQQFSGDVAAAAQSADGTSWEGTSGSGAVGISDQPVFELRAMTQRHHEWLAANEARAQLRLAWAQFFRAGGDGAGYDVMLMPVGPTPAFPHDHSHPEVVAPFWRQSGRTLLLDNDGSNGGTAMGSKSRRLPYERAVFWSGIPTVAGLPSTILPIAPVVASSSGTGVDATESMGDSNRHLPVGIQIVGPEWGDRCTLRCARLLSDFCARSADESIQRVGFVATPLGFE